MLNKDVAQLVKYGSCEGTNLEFNC